MCSDVSSGAKPVSDPQTHRALQWYEALCVCVNYERMKVLCFLQLAWCQNLHQRVESGAGIRSKYP
jgi:hypothetical protein